MEGTGDVYKRQGENTSAKGLVFPCTRSLNSMADTIEAVSYTHLPPLHAPPHGWFVERNLFLETSLSEQTSFVMEKEYAFYAFENAGTWIYFTAICN